MNAGFEGTFELTQLNPLLRSFMNQIGYDG